MLVLVSVVVTSGAIAGKNAPTEASKITFPKRTLKIGGKKLDVEIADNQERAAQGLMFRKNLPEGTGMLFVFQEEQIRSFWMKNTLIPLSIGYFDSKKVLIDIQDMEPMVSDMQKDFPTYVSKQPAQFALEVPKGWYLKHKIGLGQKFELK